MKSIKEISNIILDCPNCNLAKTRLHAVPGQGNSEAKIMFVGEAPGKNEDLKGIPFVGAAGKYLDKLLELAYLSREEIFITNIVKCRPPDNRDPLTEEIEECSKYLNAQINLMKPKLIVTLGRHSLHHWVPDGAISKIHGSIMEINKLTICPMYHPAAALYRGNLRQVIEEDYVKLGKYIISSKFGDH
ncbi:MAG: uracil-DNA glycosylase [Dehalococcoidaceae bacterium]|nr:uracil-DNA glycosylase [Dehalococcoidaceae bacterium]